MLYRSLSEELRPIAMFIILNYIWNIVRSELKRRILAVDEAWILMQHEDSARFLFGIAKSLPHLWFKIRKILEIALSDMFKNLENHLRKRTTRSNRNNNFAHIGPQKDILFMFCTPQVPKCGRLSRET